MHGRGGRAGQGGMHFRGRAWQGGVRGRYYEIRSMSGRYASYWNAFLFNGELPLHDHYECTVEFRSSNELSCLFK